MTARIYFFDMDHTLIDNDCDVSWKQFLVSKELAAENSLQEADLFFEQYCQGKLDVPAFLEFQLSEFRNQPPDKMKALCEEHFLKRVKPCIYAQAIVEVRRLRQTGSPLILITATNRIIAQPLAEYFGFDEILATELNMKHGVFTGGIRGAYCVGRGKVVKAREFCQRSNLKLEDASYYGDALADVPLLSEVGFPVVCNPGINMREIAEKEGWPTREFG